MLQKIYLWNLRLWLSMGDIYMVSKIIYINKTFDFCSYQKEVLECLTHH